MYTCNYLKSFLVFLLISFLSFGILIPQKASAISTGVEDTAFYTNLGTGFNSNVQKAVIQSDGDILVGGGFTSLNGNTRNSLVRLNSDGTEDTAFYTNLGTGFNAPGIDYESMVLQSDGKILVGGYFTVLNGNTRNRLVRLNSDGTEDTAFYINLGTGFNNYITSIALQSDGKILVGGFFTTLNGNTRNRLVRLNSDGTEDTAFYTNLGTGIGGSQVSSIIVQSDGKILVGGIFTDLNGNTRNRLVRLNSDGTEDTAFYANLGTGFGLHVSSITLQSDGKILVGGFFTTLNGNTRNRLVRLNSDGTEDTAFYANLGTGFASNPYSVKVQSDGDILVGGRFTSMNGNTRNRLVRLNSDGTEDTAFYTNLGTGFNEEVDNVMLNSQEDILVGGNFTDLNGNTRNRLVRLTFPPTLTSTTLGTNGTTLTLTYDKTLDPAAIPSLSDYTVFVNGNPFTITDVSISGNSVILTLSPDINNGDVVTVSYTPGGTPAQDTAAIDVSSIVAGSVTNNSTQTAGGGGGSSGSTSKKSKSVLSPSTASPTTMPVTAEKNTYISPIDNKEYSCTAFTKYLKIGLSQNDPNEVKLWQAFLNREMKSSLSIDGKFGKLTEQVVKLFQQKYASTILTSWSLITPTGYIYKATRAEANKILGCPEGPVLLENGVTIDLK